MTRRPADALAAALARIDDSELIELTRALVRIPSVVRPGDSTGNEREVARHVERWFAAQGLEHEVQDVAPGRPNVVAWLGDKGRGRSLLLEGHTDVVTEGDPREWTHPPFGADLQDGRIYGRGAADMKGGLAAAMIALAALKRSGASFAGRLAVGALVDEEADMLGAQHFCTTAIGREVDAAIICEPEQNEVCLEQRGVVWARVTARGRMAHGAMPEAGVNPITAAGVLLGEVPALERRLRRLCARSRYLRPATVTPTVVQAPLEGIGQPNVIPSGARLTLDVRLTPGPDGAAVARELDAACSRARARCPGAAITWEAVNDFRLATRVERREPLVRAVTQAVRRVTGEAPRFGGVPGSTDGTILRMTLGIPIVTLGPGNRQIPHQADEHVEVAELVEAARIYVASALNFLEA
ncbi:MAG: M20 family metallopeptidase [Candidatus Rokubacteria bacterium]|nr:M20 family metallopeptidase [Candidatus Rokubacteria bacterium]